MASREEEKRKRREERMAAEAAARSAHNRARRVQYLLGGLITIAVVVAVVIAVTSGGGSGSKPSSSASANSAKIPPASDRVLAHAAKAAGCVLLNPAIEGRSHVTTPVKYRTNPPSSGNHNPVPALDGIYSPGQEPTPEHFVHALEHGRIEFQYRPGTSKHLISQLETLVSEPLNGKAAYKILLFENNTKMPYAVAATSWGHIIGCKTVKPAMFDALRDFRLTYVDKGPEPGIPPNN
ncbi:MAG: hypothetical protein JWM71_1411 [Solirubrobacteraceae bacterium]|nr:hypothetical protein [Solirubrobacteraceae bacterium]